MASLVARVRLRAPDEDATLAASTANGAAAAWPSTHHRELHALDTTPPRDRPPLDVRSPEFIEQRLENLKRKQSWRAWLDQYVLEHPESDSDDDSSTAQVRSHVYAVATGPPNNDDASLCDDLTRQLRRRVKIDRTAKPARVHRSSNSDSSFVATTLWSLLIIAFTPLLLLLYPCLRHRDTWPLGCTSVLGLIAHAFTTLAFLLFGSALVYYAGVHELPELRADTWTHVLARWHETQRAAGVCSAAVRQHELALAQELCLPLAIDAVLVLVCITLVLQSHRKWAKYTLLLTAALFAGDVPARLTRATFPSPVVSQIDPSYALVDEELLVALDGKYLKPGGTVAWVAYWGCASTAPVESCEKQFASPFDAGVVRVTFTALDHFIPCYRDPPNPLKVQDYACFPSVRLRVKDAQSIPGWSRLQPAAAAAVVDDTPGRAATKPRTQSKPPKSKTPKPKTAKRGKTASVSSSSSSVQTVTVAADGDATLE